MIKLSFLLLSTIFFVEPCYDLFLRNAFDTGLLSNTQFCYVKFKKIDSTEWIVANNSLEIIFMKYGKMTRDEYMSYITKNYQKIEFPRTYNRGDSAFFRVCKDEYVDSIASTGKSQFINHFFEDRVFKKEFNEHFRAVVSRLFDMGVIVCTGEWGIYLIGFDAGCEN